TRLKEIGLEFESEENLNEAFQRFKELADKKHEIYDEDLQAIVADSLHDTDQEEIKIISMKVVSETGEVPKADIVLSVNGAEQSGHAVGDGPVDASIKAIESVINSGSKLLLFSVTSITGGTDSQGEVTVRVERGGRVFNGRGADTDIVVASAKAYINAINKATSPVERAHPQV
ncbi:MAG TPA: alpha-isopropylmalate synthase regulatory domain-containing protein, partial [Candidatus Glassbacteria bacterium]|nr:alpha-isopropylmalate synthase regulatory domain-containing protein [Candidatus Glassbacteria bacterium]